MRLSNMTLEELTEAMNREWGNLDYHAVMILQEERVGVHIEVPKEQIEALINGHHGA